MKMKRLLILLWLLVPVGANAGWFSFFGDVASISSALDSDSRNITQNDLSKVNSFLWGHVERKQRLDGYEYLAEVLELSNDIAHLDTAAQAHFLHGNKEKAIALYEARILPTSRAIDSVYEKYYRQMKGLSANQKIDYGKLYEEKQRKAEAIEARMEAEMKLPPSDYAIWGILVVLFLQLMVALFRKSS